MVELYPPPDFQIDSFAPSPGWHRDWTIQSQETTLQKATWTREEVPTDEEGIEDAAEQDALFQFVATPKSSRAYSFEVRQTYADGTVIHWRDRESVAFPPSPRAATIRPAPTLVVAENGKRDSDGGGSSTLAIVALVVGAVGFAVAVAALLASRRSRASYGERTVTSTTVWAARPVTLVLAVADRMRRGAGSDRGKTADLLPTANHQRTAP